MTCGTIEVKEVAMPAAAWAMLLAVALKYCECRAYSHHG
ncbi:MAG: hypothetical protein QOJ06_1233 [Pseudonocardiales bacterium]|jgi:hypothetical protein|nr:hypothetical protein [Pseudonocardiales bacterium]